MPGEYTVGGLGIETVNCLKMFSKVTDLLRCSILRVTWSLWNQEKLIF